MIDLNKVEKVLFTPRQSGLTISCSVGLQGTPNGFNKTGINISEYKERKTLYINTSDYLVFKQRNDDESNVVSFSYQNMSELKNFFGTALEFLGEDVFHEIDGGLVVSSEYANQSIIVNNGFGNQDQTTLRAKPTVVDEDGILYKGIVIYVGSINFPCFLLEEQVYSLQEYIESFNLEAISILLTTMAFQSQNVIKRNSGSASSSVVKKSSAKRRRDHVK